VKVDNAVDVARAVVVIMLVVLIWTRVRVGVGTVMRIPLLGRLVTVLF
jgi:hypothetical protein